MGSEVSGKVYREGHDVSGSHVLVVDHEPERAGSVRSILAVQGYRVSSTQNGREALAALAEDCFDLILSEVILPVMDGFDLLRALRSAPDLERIPFLMIIARPPCGSSGVLPGPGYACLVKPFSADELLEAVQQALTGVTGPS